MRRKHQLIPAATELLETRVVPSHVGSGGVVPSSDQRVLSRETRLIVSDINLEFDSFRNDYNQARGTYFTSIQNQSNPSQATTYAFVAYTTQRVSLLAQETLSAIFQTKYGPAQTRSLKQLVATKIIGPRGQMPSGSLARSLLATIPQPGTTAPTSSLYSLGQDNAIASAQVAILNGVEDP